MDRLEYPTNADEHAEMRKRQAQNRATCTQNEDENWMRDILEEKTQYGWTRQAQWGNRLFDFWCHAIGTAVEVDGPEHNEALDTYRDEYNFRRSGIVVLRVDNRNTTHANRATWRIGRIDGWETRREEMDLVPDESDDVQWLADRPYDPEHRMLDAYLSTIDAQGPNYEWLP